jgi:hypothetical protein
MKYYYNPKEQAVGYLEDGIYYKNTSHFMVMYQGYGISDDIIEKLIIDGCKFVHLTYTGKRGDKLLKSNISQWIDNPQTFLDTSMGFKDPQTFVSEIDMELIG